MPARLTDIRDALRTFGGDIEDSGGPHPFKATLQGKRPYPIKAHNGWKTMIGDEYVRGLCRSFEIDKDAFWKLIRGGK